jgi:hypothetical protein
MHYVICFIRNVSVHAIFIFFRNQIIWIVLINFSMKRLIHDQLIGIWCFVDESFKFGDQITNSLEQWCYKELRNESFQSVKIVMCIYRKLLVSCKEQMWVYPSFLCMLNFWKLHNCLKSRLTQGWKFHRPLFASSLLSIMHTLLDQTRQDEMRIIGCQTLYDFLNNQVGALSVFFR